MKTTAERFKVLSVDTRIRMIQLLKEKGCLCVNALADNLGITQSAVSQHLRIMKAAGLVRDERKGYWIHYSLNEENLERYRRELEEVCRCGCREESPLSWEVTQSGASRRSLEDYKRRLQGELRRVEKMIKDLERQRVSQG